MLKQQTVNTSLGQLTFSSLALGEIRQLESTFAEQKNGTPSPQISDSFKFVPFILMSVKKVHQDMTLETLEGGLSLEDFRLCFDVMMRISGLMADKTPGEAPPVQPA